MGQRGTERLRGKERETCNISRISSLPVYLTFRLKRAAVSKLTSACLLAKVCVRPHFSPIQIDLGQHFILLQKKHIAIYVTKLSLGFINTKTSRAR